MPATADTKRAALFDYGLDGLGDILSCMRQHHTPWSKGGALGLVRPKPFLVDI